MGYNISDIIDKAINITIRKKAEYESIGKEKVNIESIRIMSIVLMKDADKTIKYYEELKKSISIEEAEDIDFHIYDKMSFLVNEFNKKIYTSEINNVRDYLEYSLLLEKDVLSLLIDVQGRFVKYKSDVNKKTYKILSELILNKANHIENLEKILKN